MTLGQAAQIAQDLLLSAGSDRYLFRGQGNESWNLEPRITGTVNGLGCAGAAQSRCYVLRWGSWSDGVAALDAYRPLPVVVKFSDSVIATAPGHRIYGARRWPATVNGGATWFTGARSDSVDLYLTSPGATGMRVRFARFRDTVHARLEIRGTYIWYQPIGADVVLVLLPCPTATVVP